VKQFFSQTAAEKVAIGYCKCADKEAFKKYVDLFNSNNEKAIRSELDSISLLQFNNLFMVEITRLLKDFDSLLLL
jgi:hypothetical protein